MTSLQPQVQLLDLRDIVARLRVQCPSARHVERVKDLATAQEQAVKSPSLWVVPDSDEGEGVELDMRVSQFVITSWTVVIAVANYTHEFGDGGDDELRIIRQEAIAAMLGWTPTHGQTGSFFVRGQFAGYSSNVIWWEDTFGNRIQLRQAMT